MLLGFIVFGSCKKDIAKDDPNYIVGWTRVIGVRATDTSTTKQVHARVQAGLTSDEDSQLRAELMAYMPLPGGQGKYTVRITNLTNCQMILRWNYENLAITSIDPNDSTAGTAQADVIKAGAVKTYTLIGKATVGKIFVKSEKSNSTCNPSRQLILIITTTILPIEFTSIDVKRVDSTMIVKWSTEAPGDVDQFLVMWTPTGDKRDEVCKYILASDPKIKEYSAKYPAIRKEVK